MSESDIVVGSVVEGVVTGITHFGAFVSLPNGKTGLVHISEVADAYVRDVHDFLNDGDKVKVKILSYDGQTKIGLSIRQAEPKPAGASVAPRPTSFGRSAPSRGGGGGRGSFEDKLARFMKEADEKQSDLKKHHDKRGHRGGHGHGEGVV